MTVPPSGGALVWRLASAQALSGANATIVFATGAVIGRTLAPTVALATLPVSLFMVGMAASTLPAGFLAQRHGRQPVFLAGQAAGLMAGLLGALAIFAESFAVFCLSIFLAGVYGAVVMTFRFAAAECVAPAERPRALTTVLAGGIASGLIGGVVVTGTMNLAPAFPFLGTYLAAGAIAVAAIPLLSGVRLPPVSAAPGEMARPLRQVVRQSRFVAAAGCSIVSYLLMNYLMTSAPLAMRDHGHTQFAANSVVQWHVVAMYAPSLVTGRLMTRFGAEAVTCLGLAIIVGAALLGIAGIDLAHFMASMVLLGIGWNFGFAGGSAMVLRCHRPDEAARVQALNDFLVFGTVAVGSFASGGILAGYGWIVVCLLALPPAILTIVALLFYRLNGRSSHSGLSGDDRLVT